MKTIFLLASLLFSACLSAPVKHLQSPPFPSYRLIATSEEKPAFWVPREVVEALSSSPIDFIDITDSQDADPSLAPMGSPLPNNPAHQTTVRPLLNQLKPSNFEENLNEFSTAFNNRYYTSPTGTESTNWLFNKIVEAAGNRSDITVSKFSHTFPQDSIIARIQGSASDELVILGAHLDSTSFGMPTGSAPGADDDGSGTMGILEIFRVLASSGFRPENTIEFQWYAAEEVGLLGSGAVAKDYQSRRAVVRSMMQLDMIGYDVIEATVGLVTDFVDAETVEFSRRLVTEYLQIGYTNTVCGYGCSDHASWTRNGYRSCFPFEAQFRNRNPFIHTPNDTINRVSVKHATEFMKLGLAFAVELSYI